MATNLQLSDELYERARKAAAEPGKSLDEFVGEALLKVLSDDALPRVIKNGLPVMALEDDIPAVDVEKARQIIEDTGF